MLMITARPKKTARCGRAAAWLWLPLLLLPGTGRAAGNEPPPAQQAFERLEASYLDPWERRVRAQFQEGRRRVIEAAGKSQEATSSAVLAMQENLLDQIGLATAIGEMGSTVIAAWLRQEAQGEPEALSRTIIEYLERAPEARARWTRVPGVAARRVFFADSFYDFLSRRGELVQSGLREKMSETAFSDLVRAHDLLVCAAALALRRAGGEGDGVGSDAAPLFGEPVARQLAETAGSVEGLDALLAAASGELGRLGDILSGQAAALRRELWTLANFLLRFEGPQWTATYVLALRQEIDRWTKLALASPASFGQRFEIYTAMGNFKPPRRWPAILPPMPKAREREERLRRLLLLSDRLRRLHQTMIGAAPAEADPLRSWPGDHSPITDRLRSLVLSASRRGPLEGGPAARALGEMQAALDEGIRTLEEEGQEVPSETPDFIQEYLAAQYAQATGLLGALRKGLPDGEFPALPNSSTSRALDRLLWEYGTKPPGR